MSTNNCSSCGCNQCTGRYCASQVSIFSGLSDPLLKEITANIETRNFSKGDMIFRFGEVSDKLYIVKKGKLKIYNYNREGKEQILYLLSDSDFIGELSLLKQDYFEYNAEALESTSLCIITKQYFESVLNRNPEISLRILEALHDRVVKLEKLVQNLSTKDIEARIASFLLTYLDNNGKAGSNGIVLELPLNREEIGNYIGTTRETISRKMASMQEQGIIEMIGNKSIVVKDMTALKELL